MNMPPIAKEYAAWQNTALTATFSFMFEHWATDEPDKAHQVQACQLANSLPPGLLAVHCVSRSAGSADSQTHLEIHELLCMLPLILTVVSEKADHARQGNVVSVEVRRNGMVCIRHVVLHAAA